MSHHPHTGTGMIHEKQANYIRQATILRKNLLEWDRMLNNPRGEDWPTMLGRLNAAYNQTRTLDSNVDDVLEHAVYMPIKSTANPQDIPLFLSTRLEPQHAIIDDDERVLRGDPVKHLEQYETNVAKLVLEYEDNMERF